MQKIFLAGALIFLGMQLDVIAQETTGETAGAKRVITLGPSIAQTIAALGATDRIVARSQFLQAPPELVAKPSVGGLTDPNLELVLSHKPDLVVALEFLPPQTAQILQKAGIRVESVTFSAFEDIMDSTLRIGDLLGPQAALRARKLVETWKNGVETVAARVEDRSRRDVLITFGIEPIYCPGDGSYLDTLLTAAGGENIARGAGSAWPQLNREAVIKRDPAVILIVSSPQEREAIARQVATWPDDAFWSTLTATKRKSVYWADSGLFAIPGPHMLQTLHILAGAIHPEIFEDYRKSAIQEGHLQKLR